MAENDYGSWRNVQQQSTRLFIIGLISAIVLVTLIPLFIMLLWNWLIPTIFSTIPKITFLQALGLKLLSLLLLNSGEIKTPAKK
tara:strand:- start:275 stop:526 length:252 start_codon:yes stop_codon:yes gene_type:complete